MSIFFYMYIGLLVLMVVDVLYMITNFDYSYRLAILEREAMHPDTDPNTKRRLNIIVFNHHGLFRALIKTYVFAIWFISGLFTPFWMYHIALLILNYLHEFVIGRKINFSEFSFLLKLLGQFLVYLLIFKTFLMMI